MKKSLIYIGKAAQVVSSREVKSEIVSLGGEDFYCIRNYDLMKPFLMSIVSSSNHWMYISSNGGVTAGRVNPDNAVFPYYTDDKIHDSGENTGAVTIIRCTRGHKTYLWEPFSGSYSGIYKRSRNLFKNVPGNKIIFEEKNSDLGLIFRYAWMNSDLFGWVRKSEIINISGKKAKIEILDGIRNILPFGITRQTQMQYSTLMDAYKKNELLKGSGLGLFRMSSIPVDRAEPSEALKVTTVWACGFKSPLFLLSSAQADGFREGRAPKEETGTRGTRGAFLVNASFLLGSGKNREWIMAAETMQDASAVQLLVKNLKYPEKLQKQVLADIEAGTAKLKSIVSGSDGIQQCDDKLVSGRHFSNVLFNVMRGGLFLNEYRISKKDFVLHLSQWNKEIASGYKKWVDKLGETIEYQELIEKAEATADEAFIRVVLEYLPLSFSRRHGDPSRPWNIFAVNIRNEDGSDALFYQGNWRDIFQNWEALAMSYPLFTRAMICKFLNASTADGYNPYRISREGFDWEIHDPSDPWSNIGYWGDHQIIYLLKLLEISNRFFPGEIESWLDKEIFVFANVPYRIKPFKDIVRNPQDSIVFDEKLNKHLLQRAAETGADGKLVTGPDGKIYRVNFSEKILVSILAKLSNFIPGAGIWMNTQRPDWNDANNALTGYGVSMITLYHLRRHLEFLEKLFHNSSSKTHISTELMSFFQEVRSCFSDNKGFLGKPITDNKRKEICFSLGNAGSDYREKIYKGFSGEKNLLKISEIVEFIHLSMLFIDDTIRKNQRSDGMYHSYNLISISKDKMVVRNLYEMLEGQVSVLGSGFLSPEASLKVLDSLRKSAMFRKDQNSYTLYPDRELALFTDKNIIPEKQVKKSRVLQSLLKEKNNGIIVIDTAGKVHFNSSFNNASALKSSLDELSKAKSLSEGDIKEVLDVYESVFDHQSFTGRSGTFFKYEGLGSIYWHMVSKLLLATGEIIHHANEQHSSLEIIARLIKHYRDLQDGIGAHKNPKDYGAFTTDPYSHTPSMLGVQQPGMTGQVKEDILSRWLELGIIVQKGVIMISPLLLRKQEFIFPRKKGKQKLHKEHYLKFSFCGVPFEYFKSKEEHISVHYKGGKMAIFEGLTLDAKTSSEIACRQGKILKVEVRLNPVEE